jgi:hypothetical protein
LNFDWTAVASHLKSRKESEKSVKYFSGDDMRPNVKKSTPKPLRKLSARYLNDRAYWQLKSYIDQTYPPGHYIGIVDGKIVADAADFDTLHEKLKSIEKRIDHRMVVQAGVDYLKKAVNLF